MIKTLTTWALLTACGIALGWLFFGWGLDQLEKMDRERPPWSKPSYTEHERQLLNRHIHEHAYQLDFAAGRTKTSGHGYYDRRRERGR